MTGVLERYRETAVKSDGSAQLELVVPWGETWSVNRLVVTTRVQTSPTPSCAVFRGRALATANLISSTTNGNANSAAGGVETFFPGEVITAIWTGGSPNDTARLEVHGTVDGDGYR